MSLSGLPTNCAKCMRGATGSMEAAKHLHSPLALGTCHRLDLATMPVEADGAGGQRKTVITVWIKSELDLAMEHSVSDVIPG
eukprot:6461230-Amphidinium_carterae.1